jgi:phospholipid/cholesterol/gamma-HCH transport system substrate-binding protein
MKRILCLVAVIGLLATGCGRGADAPTIVAYFEDVGDLVKGGQVQMNDVEIGRIADIALVTRDGRMLAEVTMEIDAGRRIPAQGLEAIVRQTSLLGEQFVQLKATSQDPPFIQDDTLIPVELTDRRVDIETFLGDLSALVTQGGLEDLNRFTHAQALILEERGKTFGQTIEELEKFTSVLANRRFDVQAAISQLASAGGTLATNQQTVDEFIDSLDEANALLAEEGDQLGRLFSSLQRFGRVNNRFLAKHEKAISRQFKALRPILEGLAGAEGELRVDISQLRTFLELFPKSFGGGPGRTGKGDYIQAEAVLCEVLGDCHTQGEKGDVPGQGS